MYCELLSTWATAQDLYDRYGDEFVDNLAIRRVWDVILQDYVADESDEGKARVIDLALCDAKSLIKKKLSCYFSNVKVLDESIFSIVKIWHIRLTIDTLKVGGDCFKCKECIGEFDEFCKQGSICSDDGVCLKPNTAAISVSKAKFPCECKTGCCKC